MQFLDDNVYQNTCTIDGKGTFHGMGIIATITNGIKAFKPVKEDIVHAGRIPIHAWDSKEYWQTESPNLYICSVS